MCQCALDIIKTKSLREFGRETLQNVPTTDYSNKSYYWCITFFY